MCIINWLVTLTMKETESNSDKPQSTLFPQIAQLYETCTTRTVPICSSVLSNHTYSHTHSHHHHHHRRHQLHLYRTIRNTGQRPTSWQFFCWLWYCAHKSCRSELWHNWCTMPCDIKNTHTLPQRHTVVNFHRTTRSIDMKRGRNCERLSRNTFTIIKDCRSNKTTLL